MSQSFNNIKISVFNDEETSHVPIGEKLKIKLDLGPSKSYLKLVIDGQSQLNLRKSDTPLKELRVANESKSHCRVGKTSLTILASPVVLTQNTSSLGAVNDDDNSTANAVIAMDTDCGPTVSAYLLTFRSDAETSEFLRHLMALLSEVGGEGGVSSFNQRTEAWSAEQYFQFYSYLSQQQNMMQDYTRTASYQRAVLSNLADFRDRVVLDVGAGSGILSFFAVQAGARRVYAVEASNMAEHCQRLVEANGLADRITVVSGKMEEVKLPESVDLIISEPMGYMLFNERMLESYIHARKFLRPGGSGKMFPSVAKLFIAPFSDEALFMEQYSKANFWFQQNFHGVDLSKLRESAVTENFRQPIVDTFDISICMAPAVAYNLDFLTVEESELAHMDIPVSFTAQWSGTVHGYAFWFDVGFLGSSKPIWLSTAPTEPLTHWYQVRCLFETPLYVQEGQHLEGRVILKSNPRQSYDVDIELNIPGTMGKVSNQLDLKNPYFRYTFQSAPQPQQQQQTQQQQQQQPTSSHQSASTTFGGGVNSASASSAAQSAGVMQQQLTVGPSNSSNVAGIFGSGQWAGGFVDSLIVTSSAAVSATSTARPHPAGNTMSGGSGGCVPSGSGSGGRHINPVIVSSMTACPVQHTPPPSVQTRIASTSAYHI